MQGLQNFNSTLAVLSAMITPAVLILATGQLILTTSQRLARALDRARKLSESLESLMDGSNDSKHRKKELLYELMTRSARRSVKLQQAMTILYIALSIFVWTSISIGLLEVLHIVYAWIPVAFGLTGVAFLFYATILLIMETKIARGSVQIEMSYLNDLDFKN
jgi:hypothetical protein